VERRARAVFVALLRAVTHDELSDNAVGAAQGLRPLVSAVPAPHHKVLPAEVILQRVAERDGLDADGARRATAAVLETIAERIPAGEVDDMLAQLPTALHEPLRRGSTGHREGQGMSVGRSSTASRRARG
jgi:hypothetical protein